MTPQTRILYVDDEPMMHTVICTGLGVFGLDVVAVGSAREALDLLEKKGHKFDVVLTDLSMPKMDGLRFAAALRQLESDLPIVALSGSCSRYLQTPEDSRDFDAVLEKPGTFAETYDTIVRVVHEARGKRPKNAGLGRALL